MRRGITSVTALMALAFALSAADQPKADKDKAADSKEVKIIARTPLDVKLGAKAQQTVIRSAEDLEKATGIKDPAEIAKMLKVESIDFKKQVLILVAEGKVTVSRSTNKSLKIASIVNADDGKKVTVNLVGREFTGGPVNPKTHALFPGEIVIIEIPQGQVDFVLKSEKTSAP